MCFIKRLIENPWDFFDNIDFSKALIDQHTGFIETQNLLNILISAFKFYFGKKSNQMILLVLN